MSGTNPYIAQPDVKLPKQPYKMTFVGEGKSIEVEVDPAKIPYSETGLPGSILSTALGNGVVLEHSCGGVCACSTCHVIVKQGLESCNEALDEEADQLDEAPGTTLQSRLACQCVPDGTQNLIIEIPDWNTNLVREGH